MEEFIALADPSLSLLSDDQESAMDEFPQHKITDFRYADQVALFCSLVAVVLRFFDLCVDILYMYVCVLCVQGV